MKTLIHAPRKPKRSFVPVTPFAFESFEIPVRRASGTRLLQSKAALRKANSPRASRLIETTPRPIDAAQPAKIFLPAPSMAGQGLTLLRFGARPLVQGATLHCVRASLCLHSDEYVERQPRLRNETNRATLTIISLVPEAIGE